MNKNKLMKLMQSPYDEFNAYTCSNFYAKALGGDFAVVTFEGYECLYPNFNKIITISLPKNIIDLTTEQRQALIDEKIKQESEQTGMEVITCQNCIDSIHPNTHMYKYLFSEYTKHILDGNGAMFFPPYEDVCFVKNKISAIHKPIVCINGRNLGRNNFRNNLFKDLISFLISEGVFVINCTINQPGFQFDTDSYLEPGIEIMSYNRNLAYFKEAAYVISVLDSGGISTHLMSDCNFLLIGQGGWVDNVDFGFNGNSIVSARINNFSAKTQILNHADFERIKNIIYKP